MAASADATETIDEPKSARMEQRTKPHVKATIQRAAALMGVDETAFVVTAAYERALSTLASHERLILSAEDREVFFAALENPPAPNPALKQLFALHKRLVVEGD
jgi:uncharacterized protein (DUF1778 family)